MIDGVVKAWHEVFELRNLNLLDGLLADNAVLVSPVVYTHQEGKAITKK